MTVDQSAGRAYVASYDGRVSNVDLGTGAFHVYGNSHTNSIVSCQVRYEA